MYLFSVSRLSSEPVLDDFVNKVKHCKYYIENENFHSVCAAYLSRNEWMACFPFSIYPVSSFIITHIIAVCLVIICNI